VIGLLKNNAKVPFISLSDFIDHNKLTSAKLELESYWLDQKNNNAEEFIGYNGPDWADSKFQERQIKALPATVNYIRSFCDNFPPFNIRWEESDRTVLLHQDIAPFPSEPWNSLVENYKQVFINSYYGLIKDFSEFRIVDSIKECDSKFNGLDLDYDAFLKSKHGQDYVANVKESYKLHLIISDTKSLFIYDNVTDEIHDFTSPVSVFNAKDYHDTRPNSHGISIQFPMSPYFLKQEVKNYCEL
jgi:hypothetical protein